MRSEFGNFDAPLLMLARGVIDAVVFQVRDVWYEAGTVWCVHKDGFSLGE